MLVVMGENADGYTMGKIVALVIHQSNSVYFVCEKCMAVPLHDMGIYAFRSLGSYNCVNQEDLLDYYPLQQYKFSGMPVTVLHHACLPDVSCGRGEGGGEQGFARCSGSGGHHGAPFGDGAADKA